MLNPPFKLAPGLSLKTEKQGANDAFKPSSACCQAHDEAGSGGRSGARRRIRLGEMDQYLHCSVLGTCLGTGELRKLVARLIPISNPSDLEIHHEAVWLAGQNGTATKALQKALDERHAAAIRRFGLMHGEEALAAAWNEALSQGEVPGAYWAMLTHPDLTAELRKKVFGDVHMLSHLVGAANRADIRRLVAIERENADLRDKLEKQQQRTLELVAERNLLSEQWQARVAEDDGRRHARAEFARDIEPGAVLADAIALQTHRRDQAEAAAAAAAIELERLRKELDHLHGQADELARELAAAEQQLRATSGDAAMADRCLEGQRILYVGGRPSSAPAIRDLVGRLGGEIQRHDGGFEDRKGLLAAGVAWASVVVFPVDCIDHDSALNLKRACQRLEVPFVALRTSSVASFVSGVLPDSETSAAGAAPMGTAGDAAASAAERGRR